MNVLDIALQLAASGLPVFPCSANKRPAISEANGGHGFLDAVTDPAAVRALFARAPHAALVGVPTGTGSGLLIVDIDPAKGGDRWESDHRDQLPETLIHGTQHGGRHWVFQHVAGVRNSVSKIAPGVDVRAEGGYAIFPPSPGYTVVHDVEIAAVPAWLLVLLQEIEARHQSGQGTGRPFIATPSDQITDVRLKGLVSALLKRVSEAPEGLKHDTLLRIARTLGGYGHLLSYTENELVALLLRALPDTVIDWSSAEQTARDGLRHGRRSPLQLEERWAQPDQCWDPWEDPEPPAWPGGILPRAVEDTLAAVSLRDGVDLGALCTAVIAAASTAAPKDARFAPYLSAPWSVPAIIWLMLIGESGLRKTLLDDVAFAPIHAVQRAAWSAYRHELNIWRSTKKDERGEQPAEPHSLTVNDYTPEALHAILGRTTRGLGIVKDELSGFFDFARYGGAVNHGARAFFLSAYEDQPCPVHRVGRESLYIEHTGASVFGVIQPQKLAKLTGLEDDGLLQRFNTVRVKHTTVSQALAVHGLDRVHTRIERLCRLQGLSYGSTAEGEAAIRATEAEAQSFATISDFGPGWRGFCHKLHGTHARLALILHLLEDPDAWIVPAETVRRAGRLTRYLLQHARDFYSLIPDGRLDLLRDIAGWLLTRNPGAKRIVASDLTASVRRCRGLGSKGIAEALDPFVTGGWLEPETSFPSNRAWRLNPAVRAVFRAREVDERERRTRIREAIRGVGEPAP